MAGLCLHSPMLHPQHYCSQHRDRGQSYWLSSLCKSLSYSASSRFIPALSLTQKRKPPPAHCGGGVIEVGSIMPRGAQAKTGIVERPLGICNRFGMRISERNPNSSWASFWISSRLFVSLAGSRSIRLPLLLRLSSCGHRPCASLRIAHGIS